jgi:hypothetical protein
MALPVIAIPAILDIGSKLIDRLFPDHEKKAAAQVELLKLQQSGELAQIMGQLEINKAEAASSSMFVAGWRPAIGWICASALAYQFVVRPLALFVAAWLGHPLPDPPALDETLWQLLFGMLGLGGLRTYEKIKGKAR